MDRSKIKKKLTVYGSKWVLVILVAFLIPTFISLLRPGFFFMQDDLQAFRIHQMNECFKDFQIPCRWVPDAGYQYGYPQFNFYPPSVYYLGAFLINLGFQHIDAVKILFILGYILSAITMFVLVNAVLGRWPAFVSAILYTYAPYKALEVYVRGALSEFWAFVFFPLIFWSSFKLIKEGKNKYFLWFAASLALLMITHNLMPVIFLPLVGVWVLYWLYVEKKWEMLRKLVLAGILGIGLSAFFVLPVLFERQYVHVESVLSGYFDYRRHFVSLDRLFISNHWGYGSSGIDQDMDLTLSTGQVHWIGGLIAMLTAFWYIKKKRTKALLAILLGVVTLAILFMIHQKSSFIWAAIPPLKWLQFPWRFLSNTVFLLSILSGIAVYFAGRYKYLVGVALMLAAVYLYGPFFQPKDWVYITDEDKFSGQSWEKQLTISIFDYTPIYAELPPPEKAPDYPEILEGEAEFISYEKGSNYQEGVIRVEEEALVRAPIFDFPGMSVEIGDEGSKVSHWNDDCRDQKHCLGLVTFKVPEGEHYIKIYLSDTPIRKAGNLLTLASIGVFFGLVVFGKKAKKKKQ